MTECEDDLVSKCTVKRKTHFVEYFSVFLCIFLLSYDCFKIVQSKFILFSLLKFLSHSLFLLSLNECGFHSTLNVFLGTDNSHCRLRIVNFEAQENHTSHETQGLSKNLLVVRRGKPFKLTLLFHSQAWNPHKDGLVLEVCLGTEDRIKDAHRLICERRNNIVKRLSEQ